MDPAIEVAIIAAMQASVTQAADDLFIGVELGGPAEDAGDQERPVHHQSVHRLSSSSTSRIIRCTTLDRQMILILRVGFHQARAGTQGFARMRDQGFCRKIERGRALVELPSR